VAVPASSRHAALGSSASVDPANLSHARQDQPGARDSRERRSKPVAPSNPLHLPAHWVRMRFRAWSQSRQPPSDTRLLTQRNVYILPTRAGFMFAATLVVLLVASLNYQLNLGYILTFLLAGSGIVSLHITHNTLRGLTLHLRTLTPVFVGDAALLDCVLTSPDRARFGIGLNVISGPQRQVSWANVPAGGQTHTTVSFVPEERGLHALPALVVESRFPFGLFRAWTFWRPASKLLVYPRPEPDAPALPAARPIPGGALAQRTAATGETEGVRAYRRGDALKLVLWKKAAKALESGGDLVSRDTRVAMQRELQLDWAHCTGLADEQRLERLTAWVLAAHRQALDYGLQLPGAQLAAASGEAQRRACLEALALWK
jgi:uncharacterized protein (DUF58 family)